MSNEGGEKITKPDKSAVREQEAAEQKPWSAAEQPSQSLK